jgi:upstream activation factor subunit UAF30
MAKKAQSTKTESKNDSKTQSKIESKIESKSETKPVEKTSSAKKSSRSKSRTSAKKTESKNIEKIIEVQEEVSDVEDSTPVVVEDERKKRRVPTKESVLEEFDELVVSIEEEITRLRESSSKSKGVKFLRSLGKRTKTLRSHATRVMKQRQRTNRKNNNNSGFLKPVPISKEMAKFTGWEPDDLRSRVDVTKYICKYIKDNELQNPEDRRQIVADSKLCKLLSYDSKKEENPLTYYRLQTFLKPHFKKIDE